MPFVPVDIAKCPKCSKSVYAAEERVAGGMKWHKQCFKCGLCNKMLDSTNANTHENELFCKVCHARKYGPKGYGFGGGAGALSMDVGEHLGNTQSVSNRPVSNADKPVPQAPAGEGCPRCGGYVYEAERMLAGGRSWHKKCYKCKDCRKHLDSTNCCEAPDKEIYCKLCYGKKFGPSGYGFGQGAGILQSDALTVSSNAEKMRPSRPDLGVIKATEGQDGCPRCGGAVFAAEQMLARGTVWHKTCFNCKECKRVLDSVLACDGPDRDVYCKLCYAKKFGPKGYGFGAGGAFLMADSIPNGMEMAFKSIDTKTIKAPDGQGCPRCGGCVFAAEMMLSKGQEWHKLCFNCADCHRPLDSVLACDGPDKDIYCKACYGKRFGPKGFGYGHSPTLVCTTGTADVPVEAKQGIKAPEGEGCPRCGFYVYAAEQMISKARIWHKRCFNCGDCHHSLDSTNLNDGPDNEIYCAGCYRRKFGPHGVGYGMGGGALQTF
ncbi:hypothetical protein GHT06_020686 [Daphnia sinensis]|uniref:LIM zinc-binding domain-containing protein n=1 Tax=Daphnia sinensis TaxID=1820382 RepID=A0AAD5KZ39_9CRUS|nr:hypothetical protein GHT06_020686 [Daphnia sinensis]